MFDSEVKKVKKAETDFDSAQRNFERKLALAQQAFDKRITELEADLSKARYARSESWRDFLAVEGIEKSTAVVLTGKSAAEIARILGGAK